MAGRYPSELPRDGRATSSFKDDALMLAEVLHGAGIRTIGVQGHVYFAGATGIAQGFDDWRLPPKITSRPAREGYVVDDQLADLTIAALGDQAREARGAALLRVGSLHGPALQLRQARGLSALFGLRPGAGDGGAG